jgi:hypothetical protein
MLLLGALFTVHSGRQPSHKEQLVVGVLINVLLIGFSIYGMITTHVAWHGGTYSDFRYIWGYYRTSRIVLIVLSSVCLLYLYQVMLQTSIKGERFRSPLFHLLRKIAPYVIILMTVRFGGSSYQWIYGETVYRIPANAGGWQIFWMYVYVLLVPAASIGLMISFLKVTAGAKRSLIQMLHLECIFTLPPAPVMWADQEEAKKSIGEFRLDGESKSTMRPTMVMAQEAHDHLITMDEHDLAAAVASHIRESRSDAGERGGGGGYPGYSGKNPREVTSNLALYPESMSEKEEL